ncbi:hypothetical protein SUGI_0129060 [Cryptomeria japonica]|nr:hypothetical protein SUGI_0129060 [Cryptomeria japonica]
MAETNLYGNKNRKREREMLRERRNRKSYENGFYLKQKRGKDREGWVNELENDERSLLSVDPARSTARSAGLCSDTSFCVECGFNRINKQLYLPYTLGITERLERSWHSEPGEKSSPLWILLDIQHLWST